MSLPFSLHSLADGDVLSAWDWYEQQQPGLGDRFVAAVGAAIESACRWPNSGTPAIYDDNGQVVERKIATTGFPYAVRYRALLARRVAYETLLVGCEKYLRNHVLPARSETPYRA